MPVPPTRARPVPPPAEPVRQFLAETAPGPDGTLALRGKDFRYLVQVLRLAPGASLEVRLPDGSLVEMRVSSVDRAAKLALLDSPGSVPRDGFPEPAAPGSSMSALPSVPADFPEIVLFQWILKGSKMDQVFRQATEAGVALVVPVLGDRCLAAEAGGVGAGKSGRWERIVREARQQSGSAVATAVRETVPSALVPEVWAAVSARGGAGGSVAITLTEAPLARKTLHEYLVTRPRTVALAIGPEGGMSGRETEILAAAGFNAVHFRTNILRAETAALYGIAAAQTLLLESEKWRLTE